MPKKDTKKDQASNISFEDIFNMLMESIEPDLTTYNIEFLDAVYADESKKDRKKRIKRYAKAIVTFKEKFEILMKLWKKELMDFQSFVMKELKEKNIKKESKELSDIENLLNEQ